MQTHTFLRTEADHRLIGARGRFLFRGPLATADHERDLVARVLLNTACSRCACRVKNKSFDIAVYRRTRSLHNRQSREKGRDLVRRGTLAIQRSQRVRSVHLPAALESFVSGVNAMVFLEGDGVVGLLGVSSSVCAARIKLIILFLSSIAFRFTSANCLCCSSSNVLRR